MKLTNMIRDAFIRAAMADVPNIDYQVQTVNVVIADAVSQLPPKIAAIYKDKVLSSFVNMQKNHFGCAYVTYPYSDIRYKPSPAASQKIDELNNYKKSQDDRNNELRSKLKSCAYACSTRKALVTMLPEFEKYLPDDDVAACRTLPVVANVVADFVKAGWPKGKAKPLAKAA